MSNKQHHSFPLTGSDILEQPVTPQNYSSATQFISEDEYFSVTAPIIGEETVILTTPKNSYVLHKHKTLNYYHGTCDGYKVHISFKKMVAKLVSWY